MPYGSREGQPMSLSLSLMGLALLHCLTSGPSAVLRHVLSVKVHHTLGNLPNYGYHVIRSTLYDLATWTFMGLHTIYHTGGYYMI
jgi:hypothetical protein